MSNLHSDLLAEAALAGQWFDHLRVQSKGRLGVTRASYGDGEQMAHALMQAIGQTLGLEKRIDAAGNLYLTLPGRDRSLPAIMTGSHLDSVPEGGNYDGAAGVVAGMAMLARWRRAGRQPAHDITVMGVRAEELSWFPAPYIGSRAAFGLLEPEALDACRRPDTGRTLAQHMAEAGFAPERIRAREKQLDPARIKCFLELHIEQGPVLVQRGLPVGIVTGIRGNLRYRDCHVTGRYGHAGAEPRESRQDAVLAGVEFVGRLEQKLRRSRTKRRGKDLVATVGPVPHRRLPSTPATKIPGEVWFLGGHPQRGQRRAAGRSSTASCGRSRRRSSAARRGDRSSVPTPTRCPVRSTRATARRLERLAAELGIPALPMASGAGHDSAAFGTQGVPTAMIFVRNDHGSHNPDRGDARPRRLRTRGLRLLVAAVEEIDGA